MYYPLCPGDKIGLVSPSRQVTREEISAGVDYLKSLGFEVVFGEHVFDSFRYMAGTAENRAADIMKFYLDKEIKAIFATSGGDGCQYVLPLLDFEIIQKNPKPFCGFSDTTALLNALTARTGLVNFNGLTLNYDFRSGRLNPQLDKAVKTVLFGNDFCFAGGECIKEGKKQGILIGGCLSLLRNLCGTPYFPEMSGKILLIEDVEEPTYKIDLMLQQISRNPGFDKIKGIIFGNFLDCSVRKEADGTIDEVIDFFAEGLDVPVIKNFPFGHEFDRRLLPLGAEVEIVSAAEQCLIRVK